MNVMQKQPHEILKPRQLAAATHLAAGTSGADVAKEIGIAPETISRWRKDPTFSAHLAGLKLENLNADRERLRSLRGKALDALAELLHSPTDSIRLQAARFVLDATILNAETATAGIGTSDPGLAAIEGLIYKGGTAA